MRKLSVVCSLLVFLTCGLVQTAAADRIADVPQDKYLSAPSFLGYVPDRIIVVMKSGTGSLSPSAASNGVIQIGDPDFDRVSERFVVSRVESQFKGASTNPRSRFAGLAQYYKVEFQVGSLDEAVAAYAALPSVDHVERIGIHALCAVPNDGYYDPYQWYHNQANDHDIDSPEAWDIQTGDANRILAILDSGTRYYHPDLGGVNASPANPGAARGNMWINNAELNGTPGVDDDGNGYTDDWIGYDFIDGVSNCWPGEDCTTKDNDPRDFNGHGTHTSGIVGMLTNDGYGMAGTAGGWGNGSQAEYGNGVKVMSLRMGYSYNYLGQEYGVVMMDAAAEAFYYAANNGATIASCSWGSSNSGGIAAAADYFVASGGLIFVAAGNDGTETPGYLNSRSDCISVAATDQNDAAASFTTYGTWVDISAPGVGIYSTYHDHTDPNTNYWASLSGTSMACPMAAATAAMIWSQNPGWTATQVEDQLYASADNIDAYLAAKYIGKMGAGRINLFNAVNTGTPCDVAADFSGTPTSGCAPLTVDFTDLSTGTGIDSWSWDFGDGVGTSTAQNPSYTYTSAGPYTVTLTVNSSSQGCGDTQTKTNYITVNPGPTAGFVGSPTSGVEPLTVDFTDQSINATGWSWDFGDGVGTSTAQNPSYTYNSPGTYTVTQTVSNACGTDQLVRTDYITVNPCVAPTAGFVGSPTTGAVPLTVNFTDQSANASSWDWDFGDGVGTSTAQNPSYTYTSAGTYTVTQTVTNACGTDQLVRTDYITVTAPMLSRAYAQSETSVLGTYAGTYMDTYVSDDSYETITEALSTSHPKKTTSEAEHRWTMNVGSGGSGMTFYMETYRNNNADGDDFIVEYSTDNATYLSMFTVASSAEQVYSYALPSGLTGDIWVRAYDANRSWGNISLDNLYVDEMYIEYSTAPGPPLAEFVGAPTTGETPLTVSFTDLSTGGPTSWSWDFGDGVGTSTAQNPSYTYTASGVHTVALTVTNAYGSDTNTKTDYITAYAPGEARSHVQAMVVGRTRAGANERGTCTVTVFDQAGAPLGGATVYVNYDGPNSGSLSDVTAGDGTVLFQTPNFKKPVGEWCFEVTDITHATHTYDPAANVVTRVCESGTVYGNAASASLLPEAHGLRPNVPNPFNPQTDISFALSQDGFITLKVYNILGQEVATLATGNFNAGEHQVSWNASAQPSGVYYYRLVTAAGAETRPMLLLK